MSKPIVLSKKCIAEATNTLKRARAIHITNLALLNGLPIHETDGIEEMCKSINLIEETMMNIDEEQFQ